MRFLQLALSALALTAIAGAQQVAPAVDPASARQKYVGFDRNDYPGDAQLPALRKQFAFTGYWLTNPPEHHANSWVGKRTYLLRNGFGFLVLANGRLDKEILRAQKSGKSPAALAREDAATAVAAARREGFPPGTILFLDQEEGGRLLSEQADYLLAWTEAVAGTAYRPGVYASGQPVPDGKGPDGKPVTITTIQDIRQHVAAQHLHAIAFWAIQDACPPAPDALFRPAFLTRSQRNPRRRRLAVCEVSAPQNISPQPAAPPTTPTATATPPASPNSPRPQRLYLTRPVPWPLNSPERNLTPSSSKGLNPVTPARIRIALGCRRPPRSLESKQMTISGPDHKRYFIEKFGLSERLMERCLGEALSAGGDYADLYFESVTAHLARHR